ncbi:hypothetical protein [Brevundimonas sp.]|uniref:hypothetical protein n=1 Tax=Brevundimonas sp. TaxID=1871086 RepID=UPI002FCB5E87
MSRDLLKDWAIVVGGLWVIQYFARAFWAMFLGGPGANKFLLDPERFRAERGPNYWSILIIFGGLLIGFVIAWAFSVASVAGYRFEDSLILTSVGLFALFSFIAFTVGWVIGSSFTEWRLTISGWISIFIMSAIFLAMLAGCGLAVMLALGFVE